MVLKSQLQNIRHSLRPPLPNRTRTNLGRHDLLSNLITNDHRFINRRTMNLRRQTSRAINRRRLRFSNFLGRALNNRNILLPTKVRRQHLHNSLIKRFPNQQRRRLRLRSILRPSYILPSHSLSIQNPVLNHLSHYRFNSHPIRRRISSNITMRDNLILTIRQRMRRTLDQTIMLHSRTLLRRVTRNITRKTILIRVSLFNRERFSRASMIRRELRSIPPLLSNSDPIPIIRRNRNRRHNQNSQNNHISPITRLRHSLQRNRS